MDTANVLSRRSLLKASSALVATVAVAPAAIAGSIEAPSRITARIAAYEAARARRDAALLALDEAEAAVEAMGAISVPTGLLPNGKSPEGWVDLSALNDECHADRIVDAAEAAKQRLCSAYAEALAPGCNIDIAAGIEAMKDRSMAALEAAKALRKAREVEAGIPTLSEEYFQAYEALGKATRELLAMVPVTPDEGIEKAAWLRGHLKQSNGHFVVQEWDALIASIGGVRLPSFVEAL